MAGYHKHKTVLFSNFSRIISHFSCVYVTLIRVHVHACVFRLYSVFCLFVLSFACILYFACFLYFACLFCILLVCSVFRLFILHKTFLMPFIKRLRSVYMHTCTYTGVFAHAYMCARDPSGALFWAGEGEHKLNIYAINI